MGLRCISCLNILNPGEKHDLAKGGALMSDEAWQKQHQVININASAKGKTMLDRKD